MHDVPGQRSSHTWLLLIVVKRTCIVAFAHCCLFTLLCQWPFATFCTHRHTPALTPTSSMFILSFIIPLDCRYTLTAHSTVCNPTATSTSLSSCGTAWSRYCTATRRGVLHVVLLHPVWVVHRTCAGVGVWCWLEVGQRVGARGGPHLGQRACLPSQVASTALAGLPAAACRWMRPGPATTTPTSAPALYCVAAAWAQKPMARPRRPCT